MKMTNRKSVWHLPWAILTTIAVGFSLSVYGGGFSQFPDSTVTNWNGEVSSFRVSYTNVNGYPITYSWTLDGNPIAGSSSTEYDTTWTLAQAGLHTIVCTLSSGGDVVNVATWNVTVKRRLYVDASSTASSPTGADRTSAFGNIYNAFENSQDGDVIWVLPGSYYGFYPYNENRIVVVAAEGVEKTTISSEYEYDPVCVYGYDTNLTTVVGFTLSGSGAMYATLRNCVITGCVARSDYYYGGYSCFEGARLENCLVTHNQGACLFQSATLLNCTVVDNEVVEIQDTYYYGGIPLCVIGPYTYVYNSIVRFNYDEDGYEANIADVGASAQPKIYYSCIYPQPTVGSNNVTSDPCFADALFGDYRLYTGSPCIDAGNSAYVSFDVDYAGSNRVVGASVDMGCYEGAVTLPAPVTPTGVSVGNGVAAEGVIVTWDAMPGAKQYAVYRAESNDVSIAEIVATVEHSKYEDLNTTVGSRYWYFIKAMNDSGESGISAGESGWRVHSLSILTTNLYPVVAGLPFETLLTATGGVPSYAWSPCTNVYDYTRTTSDSTFTNTNNVGIGLSSSSSDLMEYQLPFAFPFGGVMYESLYISSYGAVVFGAKPSYFYPEEFRQYVAIAPLFGYGSGYGDVYIERSDTHEITFRWHYENHYYAGYDAEDHVNYALTLTDKGLIRFSYGSRNDGYGGFVGLSFGDGIHYQYEMLYGEPDKNHDVVFRPNTLPDGIAIDTDGRIAGRLLDVGEYRFKATVEDSLGNCKEDTITLTVVDNPNLHPVATNFLPTASTVIVRPDADNVFKVEASDPEGLPLTWTWLIDGVTNCVTTTPEFNYHPDELFGGAHTLTCIVSDGFWHDRVNKRWTIVVPKWYVAPTGSSSNSGNCFSNAFASIQTAIDRADAGDVIYVASGVYSPVSTGNKSVSILSAHGALAVIDGSGKNRCVNVGNESSYTNTVFYGFTIRNGYVAGDGAGALGGTFKNCIIRNCKTAKGTYHGGGVAYGTFYNCQINDNQAGKWGGGAYYANLYNCTVVGNMSQRAPGMNGGSSYNTIFWGNMLDDGITLTGNSSVDPQLAYGDDGIYRLYVGSPCTDAGTASYDIEQTDLVGGVRVQGVAIDKGAVEGAVEGCYVKTIVQGAGKSSASVSVASGDHVVISATQFDEEHRFVGFYLDGSLLNGVISDGLVHQVEFTPTTSKSVVMVAFENRTYHVAPDGDDSNDGRSWSTARKTIAGALRYAKSGDVVLVGDGVYDRFSLVNDHFITIRSANGYAKTVIDGGGTNSCAVLGYDSSCTNTVLEGFTLRNGYASNGGGASYGTVRRCFLTGNTASSYGGGLYYGVAENCVFWRNHSTSYGGGMYYSTLVNCTVYENTSVSSGGGTYYGTAYNSIIVKNSTSDYYGGSRYACYTSGDPLFVYSADGDFRLRAGSPCLNIGTDSYVRGEVDIMGASRIQDGKVDAGACEGAAIGYVIGTKVIGHGDVSPCYLLLSEGQNGFFSAASEERPFLGFSTNGVDIIERGTNFIWQDTIADGTLHVHFATNIYVNSLMPDDSGDGFTPASAKRTLRNAVSLAKTGETIYVADGIYDSVNTSNKAIRIIAEGGWEKTIIDGGGSNRCVFVGSGSTDTNSMFYGFTLRNGYANGNGAGAMGGRFDNCVIENCRSQGSYYGGGTYYALLNNCLVRRNSAAYGGGTAYGTIGNCTVVDNAASSQGGGTYQGTIRNSIVWGNVGSNSYSNRYSGTFTYSCTFPSVSGTGNISANPYFTDVAGGDYRLRQYSPCLDVGNNSYVVGNEDLSCTNRVVDGRVDMGCYEGWVYLPEPASIGGLSAEDGRRIGSVRLIWEADEYARSYTIYRAETNNVDAFEMLSSTASCFYDDDTAIPGVTYWYRVAGVNPTGAGPASEMDSGWCLGEMTFAANELETAIAGLPYSAHLSISGGAGGYVWKSGADDYDVVYGDSTYLVDDCGTTGVSGDDVCVSYPLPFDFPFFGRAYNKVWVNSNGTLTFDGEYNGYAAALSPFTNRVMIAAFWKDLRTGSGGVGVSTNGGDSITFFWNNASYYSGGAAVNASVTLYSDGTVLCSYGSGNASGAFVGVSAGDGVHFRYVNLVGTSLANYDDIRFVPQDVPGGLALAADGTLSGIAAAPGTYTFTVFVTDSYGNGATQKITLEVETNPNLRTVQFDLGAYGVHGGGGNLLQYVMLGEDATAPTVRSRAGWVFDGWNRSFTNISENISVSAKYRSAYADLHVDAIDVTNMVASGESLDLRWILGNTGNPSFNGRMTERISLVSASDENDVRVIASPTFEGAVERDGSIERNLAIDVPLKGWEGTWHVRIQTAINPTMQEYAANNVTTTVEMVEIMAVPLPNLKANAVSGDANLAPGESAQFSFATTNSGAAAASAPWMDCIYLESVDSGIAVKVGDISRTNDLDSASAINGEYSLTIPEFISVAGAVRVKVVADANGDVVESDDDDNVAYSVGTFSLATNLYLTAASTSVYENVSGSGVRFTVRRSGPTTEAMTVVLSATLGGSPASATVNCPESVTIPAGSVSTVFYVKPIDNATVEGPRTAVVSASAGDCRPASLELTILDNEVPKLTVTLDKASIREGDGVILATVTRELVTDEPLTVYLTGASTSRCSYPSSVTIPAGEASVTFEISVPNNDTAQAAASLTLRASSSGYTSTSVSYTVEDDDVPGVTLSLTPEVVSEGAGAQAIYATLTRSDSNQIAQAVRVRLTASEANQLILPSEITIPKYTMAVRFAVGVVDNALDDGDREVTINGAIVIESCGCNGQPSNGDVIQAVVGIIDNDGPALALKADPTTMKEGFDPAGYLVLSHNSTLTEDLTVRLWVDAENEDEIVIPETVTIHAGETSVRIPVATLDDGVEDGGQLVSVYVEDESNVFAPASTWVQVSDQNLPDLTVAKIETVASVVAMENFTASFAVTNTGFMATSKAVPYAVHLVKGASANAISSATLVKSGTLTGGIDVGDALHGTVTLTAPEMPGDYRVAVVVDPDGTISELDSANNTGWSSAIGVTVAYTATAGVDKKVYMPGEMVTITGVVSRADGTTAGNVQIEPYVMLSGMRRSLLTTTAADGSYSAAFTPTSGEAGDYAVGACYPGVNSKVAQDSFSIIGMKRSSTANVIWDIALGDSATRTVTIQNRSAVPLTGLTVTFTDVPEECGFTYSLPDTIPANGSVTLSMSATADGLTDQVDYRKFYAHLAVDEGLTLDFPLYFHSQAQRAYLRATPTSINTTMAIGQTRYIEVTLVNDGKGDSGAVSVSVPDVNWLKIVSGAFIDNLASGESATITLAISPTAEDGLTLNSPLSGGRMAVNCANGTGCSVSLKFTPVSEASGSITVDAVDNNTYTLESAPHLSNATVRVSNPYTGVTVATGKTGTDGIWTASNIPEGTYQLTITAPNHDSYASGITVEPGRDSRVEAFLQYKIVNVTWNVEKTEIDDAYDIQLLLDFETQVPAPIVKTTMPSELPTLNEGESYAFTITLENTGVIAAEKVTLTMPNIDGYSFTLSDNGVTIPAKSSVNIAAVFSRPSTRTRLMASSLRATQEVTVTVTKCRYTAETKVVYPCGEHHPEYSYKVVIQHGECTTETVTVIVDDDDIDDDDDNEDDPWRGPGGGGGWWGPGGFGGGTGSTYTRRGCNVDLSVADCLDYIKSYIIERLPKIGKILKAIGDIVGAYDFGDMYLNDCTSRVATDSEAGELAERDKEYGELAWDCYNNENEKPKINITNAHYRRLTAQEVAQVTKGQGRYRIGSDGCIETSSGMKACLYVRASNGGSGDINNDEIVLAYAGTELNASDILTDGGGGVCHDTMQYRDSADLATLVGEHMGNNQELTIIGHSLGGGEASHACMNLSSSGKNVKCRTYNAMGLCSDQIPKQGCENAADNTINYRTDDDPVSKIGFHNGRIVTLPSDKYSGHEISNFALNDREDITDSSRRSYALWSRIADQIDAYHMANDAYPISGDWYPGIGHLADIIGFASDVKSVYDCFKERAQDKAAALRNLTAPKVSNTGLLAHSMLRSNRATDASGLSDICDAIAAGTIPEGFISTGNAKVDDALSRVVLYDILRSAQKVLLLKTIGGSSPKSIAEETMVYRFATEAEFDPTDIVFEDGYDELARMDVETLTALLFHYEGHADTLLTTEGNFVDVLQELRPEFISEKAIAAIYNSAIQRYTMYSVDNELYAAEIAERQYCARIIRTIWKMIIKTGNLNIQNYFTDALDTIITETQIESQAVCATVTLKLSQKLAMTREAFDGTLTLYNGNTTTPITNLKLDVSVLDEDGNECKDLFEIFANGTSGDMSDGSALVGGLSVAAGGTGSAIVRFIPERGAAPTEEKLYRFGGTVTYTDPFSGETATVKLTPVSLTVSPSPYLHLDYFVQRDVFADDPFTPEVVEASMPAELAVLVRNIGGGNANKVTIASAQPEMIQNEKGLSAAFNLKDYTLEASALNGATAHLGLNTVSLGTIEPNESKVAQWWLTSTIEGHFIGMSATVTPVNSWNTPDTMLVDPDVGVHKLVRSIVADGDTLPDFLVCDGSDLYGTPNEIYTAVGDQLPVYVASVASSATLPAGGEIALPLTLTPARSGWNYGYAMIPGIFRYTISRIVRGDGTEISLRNAWITDRTFRDGNTPLLEDRLHVVDEFTSGAAQAYTVYLSAKPSDVPEVVAFEGVTDGSIEYAARNAVTVVFSKPIDPATFTYNSLTLMKQGSYLNDLSALTITAADDSGTRFTIGNLSALCGGLGRYELTVQCAGIADTVGQLGTVGKSVAWTYATAEAPYVIGADGVPVRRVQSLDTISVTFSAPIKPETFTSAALRMNNVAVGSGVNIAALDASGTRFSVSGLSAAQTADGEYTLAVDATAVAGLDDTPGINTYTATWTRDTVAPVLQSLTHADGLNGTEFTLTFSEEVESESLTPNKATLKRNNSVVALPNNASLRRVGDAASCQWVLSGIDSALAEDGTYELCFSADGVTDEAGNVASGSKSVSWTVDRTPPAQITDLAISPDGGFSDADGITYTGALAVSGTLQEAGLTVEIVAKYVGGGETVLATLPTAGGDTLPAGAFSQNIVMPGTGNATLIVRLTDAAGNSSDSEKSVSVDGIALTGTLTGASDDEGVVTTTATLAFSAKPMEADVTFDKFALTRDGEAIALEGVTFAKVDDTTFTLTGLDSLCSEDGVYVLTFNGAAVRKYTSGLLMSGSLVMRWRYENPDREPPTVMEVLFDGETPHEAYTNVFSSVSVTFSEAVNVPELIANGLIGRAARIDLLDGANSVTGSAVIASAMTWDGESNTLSWQIDPLAVPAGRTRLMLDAGLIADLAGNHLAADGYAVTNGMRTYMQSETVLAQVNAQAMPMWYNGELYVGEKTADNKGKIRHYAANGTWSYLQSEGVDIEIPAQGCQGVSLAFADMDGDGVAETYVGTATGDVLKYPGGTAIASLGANRAMPYAFDIDGDGCEELVAGGMDGRIRVISRDAATGTYGMTVLADVNGAAFTVPNGRAAPIVADINHDGLADIVSGDTAGNVWAYLGEGSAWCAAPITVFTNNVSLADRSRLGYGDVNGDGIDDLIVGRSDGSVMAMLGAETPSPIVPFAVKAVVSASAGAHGAIAPVGDATYNGGDTPEYTITPDVGYHVADVQIDGVSIGATNNYVFAPLTTSHTIHADFVATPYVITYTGLKGAANPNPAIYTVEDAVTFAVPGEVYGWVFKGWTPASIALGSTGAIEVAANWERQKFDVTVNGETRQYDYEEEVTFTAPEPTVDELCRTQFVYVGTSYTAPTVTNEFTVSITTGFEFAWDILATNYWFETAEKQNGSITAPEAGWKPDGDEFTIAAVPAEHYHFTGWTGNTNGCVETNDVELVVTMDEARTIGATFAIDVFTVRFDLGEYGTLATGELVQTVAYGSAAIAPTLIVDDCYVFDGWDVAFDNVTSDIVVAARYHHKPPVTLTVAGVPDGATEYSHGNGTTLITYGDTVAVSVQQTFETANTSIQECAGWFGTGSVTAHGYSASTNITIKSDSSITWIWNTTKWWLETSADNGSVSVPSGWQTAGSTTELAAMPSAHYHFTGWTGTTNGCGVSGSALSVPMDGVRSIVANFEIDSHTVSIGETLCDTIPSAGELDLTYGSIVTVEVVNAVINCGATQYVCKGWSATNADPVSGEGARAVFRVLGDVALDWQWETNVVTLAQSVNADSLDWTTGGAADWQPEWSDAANDGLHHAHSGAIGNNSNSWIETSVEGAGTLSFVWKSSTEARYDMFQFVVDGEVKGTISGETPWTTNTIVLAGGAHTFRWNYRKSRSGTAGADMVWLDSVTWTADVPPTLAEALNPDLFWMTDGDVEWTAVRKDTILDPHDDWATVGGLSDYESSLVGTEVYGTGVLTFDWAVSCEDGYDWFDFIADGEIRESITGETGWKTVTIEFKTAGKHVLQWEYWKDDMDEAELVGENRARLDNVKWTPVSEESQYTTTTPDPVPFAEIRTSYSNYWQAAEGDYEAAAHMVGRNGCAIWESYVAGLVPDDENSKFTAKIEMLPDGTPKVTWEPDNEALRATRTYTTYGKKTLLDRDWTPVTDANKDQYHFFKVEVKMK